jgi:hypothetical protein
VTAWHHVGIIARAGLGFPAHKTGALQHRLQLRLSLEMYSFLRPVHAHARRELHLPCRYDVKAFHLIKLRPLCEHFERVGITMHPVKN